MRLTNNYNLPESIFNAIARDDYTKEGSDYSATEIIKPVQMLALQHNHAEELTEDAADRLWMLQGKAMHAILESGVHANAIGEARLKVGIRGLTLSAKPDLYHIEDKSIDDYKITSVYSFLLGKKPEWEQQLNINAYVYQTCGFPVERLRIYAILRDHVKNKHLSSSDYPEIPFQTVEIPLWTHKQAGEFISGRLKLHEASKGLADADLLPCLAEERWAKAGTWAIRKKGRKTAVRVLDSEVAAEAILTTLDHKHSIEHRPGKVVRCADYCNVSNWCVQYQAEAGDGADQDD